MVKVYVDIVSTESTTTRTLCPYSCWLSRHMIFKLFDRISLQKTKKNCETVYACSYWAQIEYFKQNSHDNVPLMKPNGFSYYFAIRKRSNMIPVSLDFASLWKKKKYKNETPTLRPFSPPLPFHPSPFLFPSHKSVIYSLTPSWNVLQISFFYSYSNKMRFIFITHTQMWM